jgi:hypothetical protein
MAGAGHEWPGAGQHGGAGGPGGDGAGVDDHSTSEIIFHFFVKNEIAVGWTAQALRANPP